MITLGRNRFREYPVTDDDQSPTPAPTSGPGELLPLALLSVLAGAAAGLVGGLFRLSLDYADSWRNDLIIWGHGWNLAGLAIVIASCAAATGVAAWLVRRWAPLASGSGIPHVECVLNGTMPPVPFRLIPVKFVGGVLAIGAGLALGREGPSVQMGASTAHLIGLVFRRTWSDCRVLMAAGAGCGLATAFNAPIAGSAFVLEMAPVRSAYDHCHHWALGCDLISRLIRPRQTCRSRGSPIPAFCRSMLFAVAAGGLGILQSHRCCCHGRR